MFNILSIYVYLTMTLMRVNIPSLTVEKEKSARKPLFKV